MNKRTGQKKRWGFFSTFLVGKQDNPMLKRVRLIQTPTFGIYVHFIYREDADRDPHDHPWRFFRMVLKGGYEELYYHEACLGGSQLRRHTPLRPSRFPTIAAHRITSVLPGTVSLVLVGRKVRTWGFWKELRLLRVIEEQYADGDEPFEYTMPGPRGVREFIANDRYQTSEGVY